MLSPYLLLMSTTTMQPNIRHARCAFAPTIACVATSCSCTKATTYYLHNQDEDYMIYELVAETRFQDQDIF